MHVCWKRTWVSDVDNKNYGVTVATAVSIKHVNTLQVIEQKANANSCTFAWWSAVNHRACIKLLIIYILRLSILYVFVFWIGVFFVWNCENNARRTSARSYIQHHDINTPRFRITSASLYNLSNNSMHFYLQEYEFVNIYYIELNRDSACTNASFVKLYSSAEVMRNWTIQLLVHESRWDNITGDHVGSIHAITQIKSIAPFTIYKGWGISRIKAN